MLSTISVLISLIFGTVSFLHPTSFLLNYLCNNFPVRGDGPPKGEQAGLQTTLSGLGSADGSVVSSISMVGGSSGGGALRKPSLCKQQSLNAKIKEMKCYIPYMCRHA